MNHAFAPRARRLVTIPLAAAALALTAAPSAFAAASLNGPSMAMDRSVQQFKGHGFPANAALSVAVKGPDGSDVHHSVVADAKGIVRFSFSPTVRGNYQLRVLDGSGKVLARTMMRAQF